MPRLTRVNVDTGVILTRFATGNWEVDDGEFQLWLIPPSNVPVLLATDHYSKGDATFPSPTTDQLLLDITGENR